MKLAVDVDREYSPSVIWQALTATAGRVRKNVVTTTYAYDSDGNVVQKTTDGTTTTYVYDYANRLIALGSKGATTTYAYDAFGTRVSQIGTSTTFIYPFKWYSVASSTVTGAKYSTTTEYVFNGDQLVSTVDQQIAFGAATGTAKTHYIHPDHLGSTNVVTNASGTVEQTLDYYPYGGTRINSTSGNYSGAGRQYVNRFADQSSLDYLNARYYDPSRGQFVTQDPVFWSTKQNISNPQSLNSYSYANDNPVTSKDPDGLLTQAQNNTLSSLAAQLQAISAQISALQAYQSSGGSIPTGAISGIQSKINAAGATISGIAIGGGATVSPSTQWSPPSSPGYIQPITPNVADGVSGVPGGSDRDNFFRLFNGTFMVGSLFIGPEGPEGVAGIESGVGGFVESNGFKFSEKYYEKLWETGRSAPGFRTESILNSASKVGPDPRGMPGFMNYVSESAFSKPWNVIMNPSTREVWHIGPL